MSVDTCYLIKHSFRKIHDRDACIRFCEDTMSRICEYLHEDICFLCRDYEDDDRYSFEMYNHMTTFYLRADFWEIVSIERQLDHIRCDNVHPINSARADIFNLALALGQKECWFCEDYLCYNSDLNSLSTTFDEWIRFKPEEWVDPKVYEFDVNDFLNKKDKDIYGFIKHKYHDDFRDIFAKMQEVETQYPGFKLITAPAGNPLAEKDGQLYTIKLRKQTVELVEEKYEQFDDDEYIDAFYRIRNHSFEDCLNDLCFVKDDRIIKRMIIAILQSEIKRMESFFITPKRREKIAEYKKALKFLEM